MIVSFSIAFVMGLINPFEIMLVNSQDFSVSYSDAFRCLLIPALLCFLAVLFVLFIALMIHRSVFEILRSVFLGVMVSSYCQELFLNGKMIVGDNGTTIAELSDTEVSINFFIHFAIIAFCVIMSARKFIPSREPAPAQTVAPAQNAEGNFFSRNIIAYIFLCIILMKTIGFASTYAANTKATLNSADRSTPESHFFSYVPTTSFSKDQNNIYVFIVDMLDTFWCDDFLEMYPEVMDELDGCTFYQNNTSQYANTFPSVCSMLGAEPYDASSREAYFERIWNGENTLSILKEHGYQVNLIMDKSYSFGDDSLIEPFCDNYVVPEGLTQELDVNVLRRILYHLSFSRTSPYAIKRMIPNELTSISNVEYITVSCKEQESTTPSAVNTNSDTHLYEYLQSAEFHANCEHGVFTIIHLNGAHDTNEPLVEMMGFNKGNAIQNTIRANFETILYYVRSAKELGVYDQTTFIILGDHGQRTKEIRDDDYHLINPTLPALLIKPANADHAPFKYDRFTGLSSSMFMASVLEFAEIDHQKYGYSYQDIEQSQQIIARDFFWQESDSPKKEHYIITGDARDFSNWIKAD